MNDPPSSMCCRVFLLFMNVFQWMVGGAMLAASLYFTLVKPDIKQKLYLLQYSSNEDEMKLLTIGLYIMIATGGGMFFVGLIGCCGAIRRLRGVLGLYIASCVLMFLGSGAALVLLILFQQTILPTLQTRLGEAIKQRPYEYTDVFWKAMETLQYQEKCCGATGYGDYSDSRYHELRKQALPDTCCEGEDFGVGGYKPNNYEACETERRGNLRAAQMKNLFPDSCTPILVHWFETPSYGTIGALAGACALELLLIFIAACACRQMKPPSNSMIGYHTRDDDDYVTPPPAMGNGRNGYTNSINGNGHLHDHKSENFDGVDNDELYQRSLSGGTAMPLPATPPKRKPSVNGSSVNNVPLPQHLYRDK